MLAIMMEELLRFFGTFGLLISLIILVGNMIGSDLKESNFSIYDLCLDFFDALNGNHDFTKYKMPIGQTYIGLVMYVFRILLMSLLAAMFINKYEEVYDNLDAIRRFNIIKMKNRIAYDRQVGGATITFFPINIVGSPFLLPILVLKNDRLSEFALRLQYLIMILLYGFILCVMLVPSVPILYMKSIINIIFIAFTRKREDYKH